MALRPLPHFTMWGRGQHGLRRPLGAIPPIFVRIAPPLRWRGVLVVGVQTIDKLLISLLLMKVLLIRLWPIEGLLVAGATY